MIRRLKLKWARGEIVWPLILLVSAALLAALSALARWSGQGHAAAFLALVSLIFASLGAVTLAPYVLSRYRKDLRERIPTLSITHRGAFFLLLVTVLGFSSMNSGNNLLVLLLSLLLAALLVSGLLSALVLHGLKVSISVPETIRARDTATCFVTLHNLKRWIPSFALKLRGRQKRERDSEPATDFFTREKVFPYIGIGSDLKLTLKCLFRRRGSYPVDGFEIGTKFPFGLFHRKRMLRTEGSILVYPALMNLRTLFFTYPELQGAEALNLRGHGDSLYGIRRYQSGDSARLVDWKSTARLDQLMVRDFVAENQNLIDLTFHPELNDLSPRSLKQFEKGVSCVAALGDHYWRMSQKFRFTCGETLVLVDGRRNGYEKFMECLALVQPVSRHPETLQNAPARNGIEVAAGHRWVPPGSVAIDYLRI